MYNAHMYFFSRGVAGWCTPTWCWIFQKSKECQGERSAVHRMCKNGTALQSCEILKRILRIINSLNKLIINTNLHDEAVRWSWYNDTIWFYVEVDTNIQFHTIGAVYVEVDTIIQSGT